MSEKLYSNHDTIDSITKMFDQNHDIVDSNHIKAWFVSWLRFNFRFFILFVWLEPMIYLTRTKGPEYEF